MDKCKEIISGDNSSILRWFRTIYGSDYDDFIYNQACYYGKQNLVYELDKHNKHNNKDIIENFKTACINGHTVLAIGFVYKITKITQKQIEDIMFCCAISNNIETYETVLNSDLFILTNTDRYLTQRYTIKRLKSIVKKMYGKIEHQKIMLSKDIKKSYNETQHLLKDIELLCKEITKQFNKEKGSKLMKLITNFKLSTDKSKTTHRHIRKLCDYYLQYYELFNTLCVVSNLF